MYQVWYGAKVPLTEAESQGLAQPTADTYPWLFCTGVPTRTLADHVAKELREQFKVLTRVEQD